VAVRELALDLDAFEGPFDLLLSLVLREELPLQEIDLADIVIAFVEHLAERGELDLDACGEFLVLISALLELKARAMFPEEEAELAGLSRVEVAVAFLAVLELRKQNEVAIAQASPFAPIRISRADAERSLSWTVRSA
jgi:segregation and condensation protein A